MEKVFQLIMISFALSLLLFLAGITTGNPISSISMVTDIIQNGILGSSIYTFVFVTTFGLLAVGAAVNALSFGNASAATTIATITLGTYFITLASDFIYLVRYSHSLSCSQYTVFTQCTDPIYWIIFSIGSLLIGGFLYSAIEYVIGRD